MAGRARWASSSGVIVSQIRATKAPAAGGGFAEAYDGMVAACNACHEQSDHRFVVIQRPTRPADSSHDFTARP